MGFWVWGGGFLKGLEFYSSADLDKFTIIELDYFLTRFLSAFSDLTTHIPIYNLKFAFKVTKAQSTVVLVTLFHIIVGN